MKNIELIKGLVDLVEEERKYNEWFHVEGVRLSELAKVKDEYGVNRRNLYNHYGKNNVPIEANIKDALRIISRLSSKVAKEYKKY